MGLAPIGHATTADGVRIAFQTLGQGPAVVMLWAYHTYYDGIYLVLNSPFP